MEEEKQIEQRIVEYLLSGENKEPDDPALSAWLAKNESNRESFRMFKKIWKDSRYYVDAEQIDTTLAWKKINGAHQEKKRTQKRLYRFLYTLSGAAAVLLLLITLSYINTSGKENSTVLSIQAEYGSRSGTVLPDGSEVRLNAGSTLLYSYNSQKKTREVDFEGEGFFVVAKNKKPFIVSLSNGLQIKVLGTSFNLQAYKDETFIRASLIEGKIELNHEMHRMILQPGEMAVYDKQTNQLKQVNGRLEHTYGWLDNKLYLDDMSLSEVCRQLERSYNVNITLEEGLGENILYEGVLQEETISDVMKALARLSKIQYQIKGKQIYITSK